MGVSWTKETITNSGTAGTTTAESLTIDSIKIDGTTIGHTSDTDLMRLSSGALLLNGTITVGVNGTGHDVNFYGATASNYMLWDESEDRLKLFIDDSGEALRLYSSDAGSGTGPGIGLYRQSASTADSDKNGYITFNAYDGDDNNTVYGKIYSQMKVVADGNEQGVLHFAVMTESSGGNSVQTGLKISGSNTNDEISVLVPKGLLDIGDNNSVQGIIEVQRGSTSLPGVINLRQCDNGHGYIWVDNDGKLRVHTSAPSAHDNGTIVGTQS